MPWLVFTNLYVALCGAALTSGSYVLLGFAPRIDHVVGVVFCSTLVIYNLDRLVEPHPGNSELERWVEQHRRSLWGLVAVATAGSTVFALQLGPAAQWSLIPAAAISIGYCIPILGKRSGTSEKATRLKDLPGAKLLLIVVVWTYATMGLPMLDDGVSFDLNTIMMLLARFFFIAAVALPFDLPDMQRDQRSGIVTIPTLLGIQATRSIAWCLIVVATIMSVFNPWPSASALLISCACTAGLIAMLRPDRGVLYFMVALDGMLLVQAGLLWIISS
jgi:4-hydroxybenzoate polyprenyltransferase